MANVPVDRAMVARTETHTDEEHCHYSWLEDYLERLEGKDAYRGFQEHHFDTRHEYCYNTLIGSLLA